LVLAIAIMGCDDSRDIPAGAEGGPCLADGTCNEGLTCNLDFICEDLGSCDGMEISECVCQDGSVGGRICNAEGDWGICVCLPSCDDGVCDPEEDHQTCPQDCDAVVCGDGVIDPGEDCDDGAANSDTVPNACRMDCSAAGCGDAVVDTGEACDDGNTVGGDGCSGDCSTVEVCGNGVVEGGELCDGADMGGLACADYGYTDGVLTCAVDCAPTTAGCYECGNGTCEASEGPQNCPADCPGTQAVDLLLVVDDSGTMMSEQAQLRAEIANLIDNLRHPVHGLPDLHIGVTSTNMGVGPHPISFCENGGDGGALLTGNCPNPVGAPFLIDDAPQGCTINKDASGNCVSDDCIQANCAAGTLATEASTGCPRCRNYSGETLSEALSCITDLGITGCGFEQPLEAMRAALDNHPANTGFPRASSILVVLLLTDEDDCSASDLQLYDPSQSDISDPLGPLNSWRCFEFGVTCDINDRTTSGTRQYCQPRTDPAALLYTTDDYVSFLLGLRDPGEVVIAAIAGPVVNNSVDVAMNTITGYPALEPSCGAGTGDGAMPGVRLRALVEQLNAATDMSWAYSSICAPSYQPALSSLGLGVRFRME
jgi:cysteine-rich repeat protein